MMHEKISPALNGEAVKALNEIQDKIEDLFDPLHNMRTLLEALEDRLEWHLRSAGKSISSDSINHIQNLKYMIDHERNCAEARRQEAAQLVYRLIPGGVPELAGVSPPK